MMDDETRDRFEKLEAMLSARFDAIDRQLVGIVARLEDQDLAHDRLQGKVDRLAVLSQAGESAVTSITALSRRVTRLEQDRNI